MKDCKHNFKPRYDEKQCERELQVEGISPEGLRRLLYHNVYIHDICIKCGKVIKR